MEEPALTTQSTVLYTDRYELTMVDAALRDGTAGHRATFVAVGEELATDPAPPERPARPLQVPVLRSWAASHRAAFTARS